MTSFTKAHTEVPMLLMKFQRTSSSAVQKVESNTMVLMFPQKQLKNGVESVTRLFIFVCFIMLRHIKSQNDLGLSNTNKCILI